MSNSTDLDPTTVDVTPYVGKTFKANDFLKAVGLIKEVKRGRRSMPNTEFLARAAEAGVKFNDFSAGTKQNQDGTTVITNTAPRPTSSQIDNLNEEFVRYPGPAGGIANANTVWKVMANKKEVAKPDKNGHGGLKTICNTCGLSLVGHMCSNPVITLPNLEVVMVTIERR